MAFEFIFFAADRLFSEQIIFAVDVAVNLFLIRRGRL
ncbi:hypothetical protein PsAD2_00492 [Pseudovibrio axinellae]|uniref:Uncharacterized protein n=1 Tax=Pseudovibrio axinellae TaxID=989403 RepID=A0A161XH26_9HYPH|nr:hypothetical protein PsAD2_00492 [Pseudovibrio axinellae]SEQ91832.1 hypothetical protein SAMN05421798_105115 [Pseudovibrio axinellae]